MTTYSEADVRGAIQELLDRHDLTWAEFMRLGEEDELVDVDPDLDFAYRNLVPHLREKPVPA